MWSVYIVRCADKTLYTGIAKDVERRIQEHNSCNIKGAKYTRNRRPVRLVYQESVDTRSQASIREAQIKQLSKYEKETLVSSPCN